MHAVTVDVEDWHQLLWRDLTGEEVKPTLHVVEGMRLAAQLLGECGVKGTFFVGGDVAAQFPEVVGEVASEGHELAAHGWQHRSVEEMTPLGFAADLKRVTELLAELSGTPVVGYRAPYFSIGPAQRWALEIMHRAGLGYDSSICPLRWLAEGVTVPEDLHRQPVGQGTIAELPALTARFAGCRLRVCGGRWFRLLPWRVVQAAFQAADAQGRSAMVYVHTYELLPYKLRVPGRPGGVRGWLRRCALETAYHAGRSGTAVRLRRLLTGGLSWGPVKAVLENRATGLVL